MMTTIECSARSIEDERREKQRAYKSAWYQNNKDSCAARSRAWAAANADANKAKARARTIRRKYGLTAEAWDDLFAAQGRTCAICKAADPKSKKGWHTDHKHGTRVVRGILCHPCNVMLGNAADNAATLSNAIEYLNVH